MDKERVKAVTAALLGYEWMPGPTRAPHSFYLVKNGQRISHIQRFVKRGKTTWRVIYGVYSPGGSFNNKSDAMRESEKLAGIHHEE